MDEVNDSKSLVPKGWKCGQNLANEGYVGGNVTIDRKLKHVRKELMHDIQMAGYSEEDAAAMIEHNLIGIRKPVRGSEALYASPEVIRLLEIKHKMEARPPPSDCWVSASQMAKNGIAGNRKYVEIHLKKLRVELLHDIQMAGYSEEDAAAMIEHNLIGTRKPARGREALYASPEAIEMMEEGRRMRKWSKRVSSSPELEDPPVSPTDDTPKDRKGRVLG